MMQRFNTFIEKWMALVTPLCLLFGVLFPGLTSRGLPYVPLVFAFITFTGGLKSSFGDIAAILRRPLPLLLTMAVLRILVPCLAWATGMLFFRNDPALVTGMVLEFLVPCAVVSLMWISIYDGNSPLSLSLVILDTVLAPFTIPFTLKLLLGSSVQMDAASMMEQLLFMIALPAIAAMCCNQFSRGAAKQRWPSRLAPYSKLCLIFVVSCNASKVAPYIREMNLQRALVALCILLLAALGYAIGWAAACLTHQPRDLTVSMIYGSGMRNISAGAVIAGAYFPGETMFPVMIGTLFQQVLAAGYGMGIQRRFREK